MLLNVFVSVIRAGQGDTLNGSISPVDVATVCVAALRDPKADGITFEVIDAWAKAPEGAKGVHHFLLQGLA